MDEILNCPFCGGEAKLTCHEIADGYVHYNSWVVVCTECSASGARFTHYYDVSEQPEEDAIKVWNKRYTNCSTN